MAESMTVIIENINRLKRLKNKRKLSWEQAKKLREEAERIEADVSDTDEQCNTLQDDIKKSKERVLRELKETINIASKLLVRNELERFLNSCLDECYQELEIDEAVLEADAATATDAAMAAAAATSTAQQAAAAQEEAAAAVQEATAAVERAIAAQQAETTAAEREAATSAIVEEAIATVERSVAAEGELREEAIAFVEEAITTVERSVASEEVREEDRELTSAAEEGVEFFIDDDGEQGEGSPNTKIQCSQERLRLLKIQKKYWQDKRDSYANFLKSLPKLVESSSDDEDKDEDDEDDEGSPNTRIQRSQERVRLLNIRKKIALEKRDVVLNHTPAASSSSSSASPSVSSVSTLNSRTQNSGLNEPPQKRGPGRPKKSV